MPVREIQRLLVIMFLLSFLGGQLAWAIDDTVEKTISIGFSSPVIVRYGEVAITQQDLETHLAGLPADGRRELVANAELLAGALANIYLVQVFYNRASEAGLLDDAAIQSQIYSSLAREIRAFYRNWFMEQIDAQDHANRARELFLIHPDRFLSPETVDLEHIVIPAGGVADEAAAMRRILDFHAKLAAGMSFAAVHAEMSDSEQARSGPVALEGIATADLLPQIGALLAQIQPGDVAPPVRTPFGWHLVRLVRLNEGERQTWEQAQDRALRMARDEHRNLAWERHLRDIQDVEYEFPEGAITALRQSFGITAPLSAEEQAEIEFHLTRDPAQEP